MDSLAISVASSSAALHARGSPRPTHPSSAAMAASLAPPAMSLNPPTSPSPPPLLLRLPAYHVDAFILPLRPLPLRQRQSQRRQPGAPPAPTPPSPVPAPAAPFTGNPAAVVLLPASGPTIPVIPDSTLLAVASEFNLSETAFLRPVTPGLGVGLEGWQGRQAGAPPSGPCGERPAPGGSDLAQAAHVGCSPEGCPAASPGTSASTATLAAAHAPPPAPDPFVSSSHFHLRWFTPTVEVALCGHATLAAAHALVARGNPHPRLTFHTLSGELVVGVQGAPSGGGGGGGALSMRFPCNPPARVAGWEREAHVAAIVRKCVGEQRAQHVESVWHDPGTKKLVIVLPRAGTLPRCAGPNDKHHSEAGRLRSGSSAGGAAGSSWDGGGGGGGGDDIQSLRPDVAGMFAVDQSAAIAAGRLVVRGVSVTAAAAGSGPLFADVAAGGPPPASSSSSSSWLRAAGGVYGPAADAHHATLSRAAASALASDESSLASASASAAALSSASAAAPAPTAHTIAAAAPPTADTAAATLDGSPPPHFVSRYFSPWNGIPEDPVNGSSHTVLGPLWADGLGAWEAHVLPATEPGSGAVGGAGAGERPLHWEIARLRALQLSSRGGALDVIVVRRRVAPPPGGPCSGGGAAGTTRATPLLDDAANSGSGAGSSSCVLLGGMAAVVWSGELLLPGTA